MRPRTCRKIGRGIGWIFFLVIVFIIVAGPCWMIIQQDEARRNELSNQQWIYYRVAPGDTVEGVLRKTMDDYNHYSWSAKYEAFVARNGEQMLQPGQKIWVPGPKK